MAKNARRMRLIAFRGIGANASGDPWHTEHYALYLTTDRSVADHYGKTGSVYRFDVSKCKLISTDELSMALSAAGYPDLADYDFGNHSIDESPIFGWSSDSETKAYDLNIDGIIDRHGNIELIISDCARLLGKERPHKKSFDRLK